MNEKDNLNQAAEQLFQQMGNLVGEGEVEARRILGDEQYEKQIAWMERNNELALSQEEQRVKYIEALTILQTTVSFGIVFACLMGLSWSLYFWIK